MFPVPRWPRLAIAVLLPILTSGCVEFGKQSIYLVFNKDRDEVHALLVYEDIRVDAPNAEDLKTAKDQLAGFMGEQQFCIWAWPFHVDLTPNDKDPAEVKKVKDLARKHITIKNGAFYTRADGKLCAYQNLTIKDASKFIAAGNDMVSEALIADEAKKPAPGKPEPANSSPFDKESQALILKAARDHHAWLKMEPGRLSLNLPMTTATVRNIKRTMYDGLSKLLDDIANAKPDAAPTKEQIRDRIEGVKSVASIVADNQWSFDQRRDRVIVSLGVGDGEPLRVDLPYAPKEKRTKVDDDLADYARTLSVKFRKDVTVDSLIEEFRKEHGGGKKKSEP